ncbi:hypothetical protein Patl1_22799 [Pistacia atlantica]|uniref:Uncharacterized protein n=1 Tax=Pistacia atlantica TaxID=434234 RepID=A0ACC1A1C6_9ROSI|nr:hypothetical protein Patl1_22799 [Pistacia atlantica]
MLTKCSRWSFLTSKWVKLNYFSCYYYFKKKLIQSNLGSTEMSKIYNIVL